MTGYQSMFKICFFVPESHVEEVKHAMFAAGAGRYENYDCCAWQTPGTEQFRPLEGSTPFLGDKGTIEKVAEYKVEMLCADEHIDDVIAAMTDAHPYEVPAFEAWQVRIR